MIHRFVFHNGRLAPVEEIRLSPSQAGLLNGWGLFTTLRVVEGIPFAFERHWKRLSRDAQITRCPFPFEADKVHDDLIDVLRANNVREGSARIYIIHNQAGFWRSDEDMPAADLLIYSADLPPVHQAVRLAIREHGRHAESPLAGVKVTSWLNNVWNLAEAQKAGWDEVILLNERGEISECTAANVFCVQEGRVLTPPLSSGCLEGVTRSLVLELGPAAGIEVDEQTLFPEDIYCSDEVFISSTNRNVIGVAAVGGHTLKTALGPITQRIEDVFTAYVREYVDARAAVTRER
jgi:branched-chain amino acid aminotransferase